MKRASRFYAIGLMLCCFYSTGSLAYEVAVHDQITKNAFSQALTTQNFLANLGIDPNQIINGNTPDIWVRLDSGREDNIFPPGLPPRSAYHFFDPMEVT